MVRSYDAVLNSGIDPCAPTCTGIRACVRIMSLLFSRMVSKEDVDFLSSALTVWIKHGGNISCWAVGSEVVNELLQPRDSGTSAMIQPLTNESKELLLPSMIGCISPSWPSPIVGTPSWLYLEDLLEQHGRQKR